MKEYEFPIGDGCTYEELKKAHERTLKIAVAVRDILEANAIPYFITFGTLIGAVRHQGFVPWDRDFDIMIEEEVYDRAIECIRRELPDWLVLQDQDSDPKYCAFWAKVRDRYSKIQTTVYESDNEFQWCGLHIDLYKLRKTRNVAASRLQENLDFIARKRNKKLITYEEYLKQKQEIECKRNSLPDGQAAEDRYYFLTLVDTTKETFQDKEIFLFEGERFWGPKNYDAYLKDCYYKGDYMVPPPYEKRTTDIKKIEFLKNV